MRYDSDVRHNDSFDGTQERGAKVEEENVDRDLPEGHDGTATVDEPGATVDEPHALVDEPGATVDEPHALVDEPGAAADGPRSTVDEGPTSHDTADPVAPALGETAPAEAGQTTPTESIATDAALSEPVSADASPSEPVSADASPSEPVSADATPSEPDSTDASVSEVAGAEGAEAGAIAPETATDLKPGEAKVLVIKELWAEGAVDGYRERWHQVQVGFLDDPQDAATKAEALLGDVLEGLREALADRKSELDSWSATEHHDTEEMRVTVRAYRDLLDRVLSW
jgi:hypothetical protein